MRWTRSVVVTGFLVSAPLLSFVACGDDGSATTNDGPSSGGGSTTGPGVTSTSGSGSTSGPTTTSGTGGAGGGSSNSPGCTGGRGLEEGEHTFELDGFE